MTRAVHMVVPAGIDDRSRPSGGNTFDRRVRDGLAGAGWSVRVHEAAGSWPQPDAEATAALGEAVAGIADRAVVLVDGLVASAAAGVLVPEAGRLRLVLLMHMPLGTAEEADVLAAAQSVVTTSAWTRSTLLERHALRADRVHVAEPGADPAELAPGTAGAGAFLSVAAVVPGKGHDVLLDALARLRGRWRCVCVGSLERDAGFARDVQRRARDVGMNVRFAGPQHEADLARSYRAADVLVLPSRGETYGMVVAEALAHGLPVVAAGVGGVPEALGHGADGTRPGLLVPPDDPDALHDALRAWLDDAHLRVCLRRAARERRASLVRWPATTAAVADALAGAAR